MNGYDRNAKGMMIHRGPYEQQITDHKRKLLGVIRKGIKEIPCIDPGELKNLIVTRPGMGYMLHLDREDILVL